MDHKEAIRLQAAEKYVLGELPKDLRDAYEEHYFECSECALEVKTAATFVETSREVFRADATKFAAKRSARASGGWFFWLRPAFAAGAMVVLLLVVAYQNLITLPRLKSASSIARPQLLSSFSLVATNIRGGEEAKIQVGANEAFALDFDFLPTSSFDHYLCQLQDEARRAVLQLDIPAEKANQEVRLLVPSGLVHSGKYSVVITGDPGGKGVWLKENQVSRMDFLVEIRP